MLLQPEERGVFVSFQHGGASKDAGAHGPPYPIIRPCSYEIGEVSRFIKKNFKKI